MRIDLTRLQVENVVAMLRDQFGDDDDERLKLDMLEGETDLNELLSRLLAWIEEDEGRVAALAEQLADRQGRKQRFAGRIEVNRGAIAALLDAAKLDKLALPEATLSLRRVAPKPVIINEALLPDAFVVLKREPDKAAINGAIKSGDSVPGVAMGNGGTSLTIRRK